MTPKPHSFVLSLVCSILLTTFPFPPGSKRTVTLLHGDLQESCSRKHLLVMKKVLWEAQLQLHFRNKGLSAGCGRNRGRTTGGRWAVQGYSQQHTKAPIVCVMQQFSAEPLIWPTLWPNTSWCLFLRLRQGLAMPMLACNSLSNLGWTRTLNLPSLSSNTLGLGASSIPSLGSWSRTC